MSTRVLFASLFLPLLSSSAVAAELRPATLEAFTRYVRATEARMAPELAGTAPFLILDTWAPERRAQADRLLRGNGLLIERLSTREHGKSIAVPDGLIHHWVGAVFIPGAAADDAVRLLQDYDRHQDIYRPAVARSRLLARSGDEYRVFLRFSQTKVITVVLNSEHEARFTRAGPERAHSRIVSTRIAEVDDPDTPREREKPIGQDGGYLWRLHTYWRFLQRDGGTYVQCESISLTRDIPFGLGWLVGPFVTSVPRESLEFTLRTTRDALLARERG